jgi:thiol-disulfide isomerase/thioredoxin
MNIRYSYSLKIALVLAVFSGLLGACSTNAFPTVQPEAALVELTEPVQADIPTDTPAASSATPENAVSNEPTAETVAAEAEPGLDSPTAIPAATDVPAAQVEPTAAETFEIKTALTASNPTLFNRASGDFQLVEFFAFWCPICQSLAPVVHGLEAKWHPNLQFVYLDIDDRNTQDIRNDLGYLYQPHLFLLGPDGQIIEQWVGYVPDQVLDDAFARELGDG